MTLFGKFIVTRFARGAVTLIFAAIFAAALLRLAPGRDIDEQLLDHRLSRSTVEALREERAERSNLISFYIRFLSGIGRGDFGRSEVFNQSVADLVSDRIGTTVRSVITGLFSGWLMAILVAAAAAATRIALLELAAAVISGAFLSAPSAVLAVSCLLLNLPPAAAVAGVVFPRVFPHAHAQFRNGFGAPHVLLARARGISGLRLFCWHVLPVSLAPLVSLAAASVTLAFGAAIPIEALADSPGVGQLAWRATLGRDLPLLVTITLLLATITVAANVVSDVVLLRLRVRIS